MKAFILVMLMLSISGFTAAADRYISIHSPGENDSIDPGGPIAVSGAGKGLFEGNVVVRIEDMDGRQLAQVATTMQRDDIAAAGPWQTEITLSAPAPAAIRLIAFSPSPMEGDAAITSKPVLLRTTGHGLENVDWQLRQYLGEAGEMTQVLPETTVDARFSHVRIEGSAGCNRFFGAYSSGPDNRLTLAPGIGSTQMACPPAISRQEQRYLALLPLVATWQQNDDSMQLLDNDQKPILEYVAAKPAALEDTHWQASGINNGRGGVVSGMSTHLATATFTNDKISGNAGCNTFTATYQIEDNRITVGPAATTRRHCAEPEGIMQQEQEYLDALARARTYTLKTDSLELRDENGALQVGYRVLGN
jgi:heat shock protein HslJ